MATVTFRLHPKPEGDGDDYRRRVIYLEPICAYVLGSEDTWTHITDKRKVVNIFLGKGPMQTTGRRCNDGSVGMLLEVIIR